MKTLFKNIWVWVAGFLTVGVVFAGSLAIIPTPSSISTAEDLYFQSHGRYFQILRDGNLPSYQQGVLADYILPTLISSSTEIDVYQQPDGQQGYAIRFTNGATTTSIGFGPQAADYTWVHGPFVSATTTP